jgi:hypothetical protein
MNTRILFYCINLEHGDFTKIVFETVISDSDIDSTIDAVNWVDDNISVHYDQFELDCVVDWIVLSYESTDDLPKETEVVKTISGKLVFEDDINSHYIKLGKLTSEINKLKTETEAIKKEKAQKEKPRLRKEYPSVWMDSSGEVYEVGFANHNEFAAEWLEENDIEAYRRVLHAHSRYYYEELQDLGWIRILGWSDPPSFVIQKRVTVKQKQSLRDYCLNNEVPYTAFPEILKS